MEKKTLQTVILDTQTNTSSLLLISNENIKLENIIKKEIIMENGSENKKYRVNLKVEAEMIESTINPETHKNSMARHKRTASPETYGAYLIKKKSVPEFRTKWIYNIVDGISEQQSILYSDSQHLLIPTYVWDCKDMSRMHLLGIVKDKKLQSIRDLTQKDIPLLKHIRDTAYSYIKTNYNISQDKLKTYFHYPPSAWLLHIHFDLIENIESTSSVEYSYDLNHVIFNLELDSDYYKKIELNVLKY